MLQFPSLSPISEKNFTIAAFGGLNRRVGADVKTLKEMRNLSPGALPVLATRKGRKKVFSAQEGERITGIFCADKVYVTTALGGRTRLYLGDDFYSLSHVYTSEADEKITSLMCRYDRKLCLFNLKSGIGVQTMLASSPTTFDYPERYAAPNFNDVTVFAHRIFGVRIHQIRATAYSDIGNWDYANVGNEALTTAAFLQNFETKSDFTACVTYKNRAVFFTADEMFEMYGKDSSQFDLVKVADIGCVCRQAVCEVDGVLYFVSKEGVMRYSGTLPKRISDPIDDRPVMQNGSYNACIGGAAGRIYVSLAGRRGELLYSYDAESGAWACEDEAGCVAIASFGGEVYFASDDAIYLTEHGAGQEPDSDSVSFSWMALTQKMHYYYPAKKRSPKLHLHLRKAFLSEVSVYVSYDGGDFELLYKEPAVGEKTITVPLQNQEYDTLQVKVCGTGEAEIDYIGQSFSLGGKAV